MKLLDDWDCRKSIYGMSFDTTSSNTGHLSAACKAIQRELNIPLLWFSCCHHIGEVILDQVWNDLSIEKSTSPDVIIFSRLRNKWNHISYGDIETLTFPKLDKRLEQKRQGNIDFCSNILKKEFTRGDYKELVELIILYLTGECEEGFTFKRPGALHKARWMAKLIYSIKIVLLSENISYELEKDAVLTNPQLLKLQRFV